MKRQDIALLVGVGVITAIISFLISSVVFNGGKRGSQVPTAESISTTFPDMKNDPSYSYIFNENALDLAQPVQVGNTTNNQPFNGSR